VTLPAGTRLSIYEIVRTIGAGGMGEVYRARDTKLARDVAIKVLPQALAKDAERLARFETEARTASALNHPNIVTIYEIGKADGTCFIAMELVDGKTMRELVGAGGVPLKRVLSIAAQAADGLAKAHAAGIVHRDLKPENVMVTRDGFVKILDFGLAKLVHASLESSHGTDRPTVTRGTEAGTLLGTVGYMSPEQASGRPADFRSDQFSLGAILYELLTGQQAFDRPTMAQTLSAIIEAEPPPLATAAPGAPAYLAWVVERCLAKDPEDRYGSTKDLARDLASMREQASGVSAAGVERPNARRPRVSRLALAAAALSIAGVGLLAFIAGEHMGARRAREAPLPRRTALTFRKGYVTGARFAPDGQTIAYSACWDGRPSEIFTTRVGSTGSRRLGIENAAILAVSSAGEMAILVDCDVRGNPCMGTLAQVPLAGGAPREILEEVLSADWSPDGKELAVATGGRIEYPIGKKIYETNFRGFVSFLRVSPDGSHVAFLEHPGRDSERGILAVVDRGGTKRILTDEFARLGPVLWSPAGDEVFFVPWGGREIRGVRLKGGTRGAPWIPGLDDVSRDGLFLDSGMLSENYRGVILARVPGANDERNLSWLGRSVAADLSSDGEHLLLYEEDRNPGRPNAEAFTTFLRPTNGSDAKLVGEGRALALSPDTSWALVVRGSSEQHLALIPTGVGQPHRLPGGGLLYRRASFFPDGRRILFNADDERGEAHSYIQDVDGGAPKPIGDAGWRAMLVSPDGRLIAGKADWDSQYFLLSADGTEPRRSLPVARPDDVLIRWSSDGRILYGHGAQDDPLGIFRLDVATGRRERFKELTPLDRTGFLRYGPRVRGVGVAVTPDGRYYAYTYFTDQSRLVLTEGARDWWE